MFAKIRVDYKVMTNFQTPSTLKDPKHGLLPGDLVAGTVKLPGPIHTYISLGVGFGNVKTEELPLNQRTCNHDLIFRVKSTKIGTLPMLTIHSLGITNEEYDRLLAKWQEEKKAQKINNPNQSSEKVEEKAKKLTIPIKSGHATLRIGDYVIGYVTGYKDYGVFVEVGNRKGLIHVSNLPEYNCPWDFQNDQPLLLKIIDIKPDGKLSLDLKNVPLDQYEIAVSDVRNINYLKDPIDEPAQNNPSSKNTQKPEETPKKKPVVLISSLKDYSVKHKSYFITDAFHRKVLLGDFVIGIVDTPTEFGIYVWVGGEKYFIEKAFLRTKTDPIATFTKAQPILLRCTGINPHKQHYFSQKTIKENIFISIINFLKESEILRKAILSYKDAGIKANLTLINRVLPKITERQTSNANTTEPTTLAKFHSIQPIKPLDISRIKTISVVCPKVSDQQAVLEKNPGMPQDSIHKTQPYLVDLITDENCLTKGCHVLGKLKNHWWYGADIEYGTKEGVLFANNESDLQDYADGSYILLRYLEKTESGKNIFTLSHTDIPERWPLNKLATKPMNVLFVGPTGVGKSSIINALLCKGTKSLLDLTTVGHGFKPCTNEIKPYHYQKLCLWDSPGLGESPEADTKTLNLINQWLEANTDKPIVLIVTYDAYSRDCHSTFSVLDNLKKKLPTLHVINRVDMLLRGQYWDDNNSCPKKETNKAIQEKITSIKKRIGYKDTKNQKIVAVCAGFNNEFEERQSYNIDELINSISSLANI